MRNLYLKNRRMPTSTVKLSSSGRNDLGFRARMMPARARMTSRRSRLPLQTCSQTCKRTRTVFGNFWNSMIFPSTWRRTKSINIARFQRDAQLCTHEVQDFSENGTFKVKREHQTRYFDTRSYTLYGVVISRHISDVNDITQEEKKRLSAMFDDLNLPPCITETHI